MAGSLVRVLFFLAGLSSLTLGVVGAFLPLLPTVPFLLLAAGCFARSSARVHRWLLGHPRLGPPVRAWQEHGAIAPRAKLLAGALLLGSAVYALTGMDAPPWLRATTVGVSLAALTFVLTRPAGPLQPTGVDPAP